VGGNPPQSQKPRSLGVWPLNPVEVCRAKLCPGPGGPLRARRRTRARPEQVGAMGPSEYPHQVGLWVSAVPTHLHSRVWSVLINYSIQLLAQQLGCGCVFFKITVEASSWATLACGSVFYLFINLVFSVLHMFCIFFLVFLVLHMYLFETLFFGGSLYFFVATYGFKILFKSVASSIFFCTSTFSNSVFLTFCLKFLSQCTIYNFCFTSL
jgi:hypothetical protein